MYYCTRPAAARSSPIACRAATRNASSFFPSTPFYHHPRAVPTPGHMVNDLAPFLRLIDDFAAPLAPAFAQHARQQIPNIFGFPVQAAAAPAFAPRFDVREVEGAYEVRGDLPGFEGRDVDVEFTDAQTLVIRGRVEAQSLSSDAVAPETAADATAPAIATETAAEQPKANEADAGSEKEVISDNDSTYSTGSYQKPTVEESGQDVVPSSAPVDAQGAAESSSAAQARAASTTPAESQQRHGDVVQQQHQQPHDQARYWHRERSSGSFQRAFEFESRVDREGVTASMKNGVLNVVVPKAAAPAIRRIVVE